ncbi:MAG: hypothetical protein WBB99_00775, partial [Rhodococcus sp. (in: high G+C Gram-positive bacteria)]
TTSAVENKATADPTKVAVDRPKRDCASIRNHADIEMRLFLMADPEQASTAPCNENVNTNNTIAKYQDQSLTATTQST